MDVVRYFVCTGVMLAALSGCATTQREVSDLDQDPTNFGKAEGEQAVIDQSDNIHRELAQNGLLLYPETDLQAYLDNLLNSLLSPAEREAGIYSVHLSRLPDFNAFALGNGHIYLNLGLAAGLKNPEQLAFILAHEIEHINRRHGYKSYYQTKQSLVVASTLDIFLLGMGVTYLGALDSLATASREHELEADQLALARLTRFGYDTCLAPSALMRLKEMAPKQEEQSAFATHPHIDDRIAILAEYTKENCASDLHQPEFRAVQQRIFAMAVESMLSSELPLMAQKVMEYAPDLLPAWKLHQLSAELHFLLAQDPESAGRETAAWQGRDYQPEDSVPFVEAFEQNARIAIEQARLAVSLMSEDAHNYRTLGMVLQQQHPQQAIDAYTRYLQLKPQARDAKFVKYKLKQLHKEKEAL